MIQKKKAKYFILIIVLIVVAYILYSSGFVQGFLDGINSVD